MWYQPNLGWRHKRLTGNQYAKFIDKFIQALQEKFPHVFLYWEHFGRTNAYHNLIKYRDVMYSFNDDIQGMDRCRNFGSYFSCLKDHSFYPG